MLNCIDNSGAAIVECIAVMRKKTQAARIGTNNRPSIPSPKMLPGPDRWLPTCSRRPNYRGGAKTEIVRNGVAGIIQPGDYEQGPTRRYTTRCRGQGEEGDTTQGWDFNQIQRQCLRPHQQKR
jgi:hypothetical protein